MTTIHTRQLQQYTGQPTTITHNLKLTTIHKRKNNTEESNNIQEMKLTTKNLSQGEPNFYVESRKIYMTSLYKCSCQRRVLHPLLTVLTNILSERL